ncbi:MAG: carboxypeptidase regulatory-like domain-containing protein, partial [Opitutaceae bacterium]
MNFSSHIGSFALRCLVMASLAARPASAEAAASGAIEGRVQNSRNGEYLEKARLAIEGTPLETFSDSGGQYRFANLPPGTARVRVFFTGLDAQTITVLVTAGATVQRDFSLVAPQSSPVPDKDGGAVKLSAFVVGASKEMDGAAIAINEQRFARNIVNVVSADEFGTMAEGNVGEFLKFLPGMSIDYVGGDAFSISMGGVPANYVPLTIDGFNVASAASSNPSRMVDLSQVSINNLARIEVYHS